MDLAITPNRATRRAAQRAQRQPAPNVATRPAHVARLDPIARLLGCTVPFNDQDANDVLLYAHLAVAAITDGKGTDDHFGALANAVNIAALLAERGIGPEALDVFQDAQAALLRVRARHDKLARYGFAGPELTQINDALHYHDIQLRNATREEVRDAIGELKRRLERKQILTAADVFPGAVDV